MSRIGRTPIDIPSGVKVEAKGLAVTASGTKGKVSITLPPGVGMVQEGEIITVSLLPDGAPGMWGLARTLVANAVEGVSKGFEKRLLLVGVGYRAEPKSKKLVLNVGYSHEVVIDAPENITFATEQGPSITHLGNDHPSTVIIVAGIVKEVVGDVAAKIRSVRKPEPYKGKGIRYINERIRTDKTGKAAR